jgi:hypothetical protein
MDKLELIYKITQDQNLIKYHSKQNDRTERIDLAYKNDEKRNTIKKLLTDVNYRYKYYNLTL